MTTPDPTGDIAPEIAPEIMPGAPAAEPRSAALPLLLLAAVFIGAMLAVPALAPSQEAVAQESPASDAALPAGDPRAVALLRKAASVGVARSWQGVEVVTAGPMTQVMSVRHRALVGTELTVLDGAAKQGATAFAPDDPVMQMVTAPSTFGLEAVAEGTRWATLLATGYVTTVTGADEVAGEMCTVLSAARADGTVAAKIWVSDDSGLVLQRQIFDTDGDLLRYSAFTEIALVDGDGDADGDGDGDGGGAAMPDAGLHAVDATPGSLGASLSPAQLAAARSAGVVAPQAFAGSLTLVDARGFGSGTTATTQLTYSDGLSSMTVTEQRGRLPSKPPAGWHSASRDGTVVQQLTGSPERIAWANHGIVFTVVSDTDEATLDAVVRALPRPAATVSYGRRMRAGLDRVGSWLDPTH